eukprot:gnl/MRDRNA2_/MRDRNA2_77588_c0_seq1.p1 gnl/MRDRNA2_/MRDRNA2_77588_c0~~gnl/MRDRNA2_/MRDRNA2_77588_c0_seq1.p1  ORF type:complete len:570 (+),score=125.55 gnl/MRDRNA2_/MRDRNA2_77588_c0_seq1:227-1711(+)
MTPPAWAQSRNTLPGFRPGPMGFNQPPPGYQQPSGYSTPVPPPRQELAPQRGVGLDGSLRPWQQGLDVTPPSPQHPSPQPSVQPQLAGAPQQVGYQAAKAISSSMQATRGRNIWEQAPRPQVPGASVQSPGPGDKLEVDSNSCFAIDVSCIGERKMAYGVPNGFEVEEGGAFTKIGHQNHALLVSTKGYTSGVHYWEFVDLVVPAGEATTGVDVGFRIGVVPRAAGAALNIDGDLRENSGYGEAFAHGGSEGDVRYGDRIGALLDLSGEDGKLSFFVNGRFADVPSISGLRKDRALFPTFCTMGHANARVRFEVTLSPQVPDVALHAQQELQWLQRRREQELALKAKNFSGQDPMLEKAAPALAPLPPQEESRRVGVAVAHTGGTVEVSSQPMDELRLRAGDAILFVEQAVPGSGREWLFEVDNEEVLARDFFYVHVEFDQHAAQEAGSSCGWALKLAFKFVAITPGKAVLKSKYARPNIMEPWTQALPVTVIA